jgi:TIR domain
MRIDLYQASDIDSGRYGSALEDQCKALGIKLDLGAPRGGASADLTVVCADKNSHWTAPQLRALQQLVDQSALILPVIEDGPAASFLPNVIGHINAFKIQDSGAAWVDSLVDETLSMTWLKRRTRRVFISYRRIDSAPIANQLFTYFNELGYEVFLDDASIERGLDFQRELKWWLNDADLLLALYSPGLTESKWCVEELTFAQSHSIGIAALEWPSQLYEANNKVVFRDETTQWKKPVLLDFTMADQRMSLKLGDFAGNAAGGLEKCELTRKALERVIGFCARNRAAAIRSRLNNLLPLVKDTLEKQDAKNISQAFGDLTFDAIGGQKCFLRVLPFRPRPEQLYGAYTDGKSKHLSLCAYPESDVKDSRAEALRWFAEKSGTGAQAGAALWAFCGGKLL